MPWKALSAHPVLARCCGDKGQVQAAAEILVTLEESCGSVEGIGNNWESQPCFHGDCEVPGAVMWRELCCQTLISHQWFFHKGGLFSFFF